MKTTVETSTINWVLPDENQKDITIEDFRGMVRDAEKEEGISLTAYKEKMNAWWENHL